MTDATTKVAMLAGAVAMGVGRALSVRWCREDVKKRCRRPVAVLVAIAVLFPLGPLAWLAWRPELLEELVIEEFEGMEGEQWGCILWGVPV